MKKALLGTISLVGFTLAAAAPAKALVPLAIAGIAVGAGLLGLFTGNAISNNGYNPPAAYIGPTYQAQPTCYLKRTYSGHLVHICH